MIDEYSQVTEAKYPIYADPSQALFKLFNLRRTLSAGKKPDYMSFGLATGVWKGIVHGLKLGSMAFKSGDKSQVGGEYICYDLQATN
jgi:AhpC/TSA antioxidant enzyme